ncbi:hypothetical protein EGW08_004179 [Elysia chlorotica]|uniref:Uncharacterized protein n=1 Tax=Elysia chlorotica TaxID=188477 RepID=A0A433U2G5_ELYCH|nr:hypothetical protein EGW08_004179 [Elysia chlorotica]
MLLQGGSLVVVDFVVVGADGVVFVGIFVVVVYSIAGLLAAGVFDVGDGVVGLRVSKVYEDGILFVICVWSSLPSEVGLEDVFLGGTFVTEGAGRFCFDVCCGGVFVLESTMLVDEEGEAVLDRAVEICAGARDVGCATECVFCPDVCVVWTTLGCVVLVSCLVVCVSIIAVVVDGTSTESPETVFGPDSGDSVIASVLFMSKNGDLVSSLDVVGVGLSTVVDGNDDNFSLAVTLVGGEDVLISCIIVELVVEMSTPGGLDTELGISVIGSVLFASNAEEVVVRAGAAEEDGCVVV